MLMWVFGADHRPTMAEVGLLFQHTAWGLLYAGACWLVYIALEPYARKIWPEILISWSRAIRGRWRDPSVGRDILIGAMSSMVYGYVTMMPPLVANWLGMPPLRPSLNVLLGGLNGIRQSLGNDFGLVLSALLSPTWELLLLLLLRAILRKPWAAVIALVLIDAFPRIATATNPAISVPVALLASGVLVFVLVRFGFLASVAASGVLSVFSAQVHTWDFSAWYAGRSLFLLALLAAIVVCAFRVSLAGQPLFRGDLFDGEIEGNR